MFTVDVKQQHNNNKQITYRYIDGVLSLNNSNISEFIDLIYSCELEIKNTTDSNTPVSYLDCYLCIDNGKLVTCTQLTT